jgi:xanthine dehydrogenase molybdopterin-binding subunit B
LSQDEEVFASKMVYHHGQVIAALLCSDIKAGRLAAQKVIVKVKGLFHLHPQELQIKGER